MKNGPVLYLDLNLTIHISKAKSISWDSHFYGASPTISFSGNLIRLNSIFIVVFQTAMYGVCLLSLQLNFSEICQDDSSETGGKCASLRCCQVWYTEIYLSILPEILNLSKKLGINYRDETEMLLNWKPLILWTPPPPLPPRCCSIVDAGLLYADRNGC